MKTQRNVVETDGLKVSRDESVELVAHHLRLVALFYETTPDNAKDTKAEVLRLLSEREDDRALIAAEAALSALGDYYTGLKEAD